jgi:hypothetical protein
VTGLVHVRVVKADLAQHVVKQHQRIAVPNLGTLFSSDSRGMELTTISQPSPPIPAPPRNRVAPLASVYTLFPASHYTLP